MKAVFDLGSQQHQVLDASPDAGDNGVSVGFGDAVTGKQRGRLSGDAQDLGPRIERLLGTCFWCGGRRRRRWRNGGVGFVDS